MLSIGKAQGSYYADLAKDDYYNSKAEKAGLWHGEGTKALGLNGNVQREEFLKLCDGFDKNGNALVQNAGQETHRTGWDLCFSAPKSVSVLWSQADGKIRNLIEEAHLEAVKKGLDYIEEKGCWTRRGHQGTEAEKAKFVIAIYEHGTSREQDPELHSHSVVLNLAVREDGTTGTIESQKLYSLQMSGGAIYRAELAEQLQEKLGVEIEKTKVAFEIKGVSKELCREFSKRREAIEAAMKDANALHSIHGSKKKTLIKICYLKNGKLSAKITDLIK
jgi:conjugative relaxase-like TrwC/TraI family protein